MKLQYLIIVFIIIAIPLIIFLTYYMSLQKATLDLQTMYDTKIITAARQAMEAFEVNTVEWDKGYSRYADEKRRDILAAINTFTTSFANGLNITGTNRETILTYIPAIMYNLYDGFYIYTPTSVPTTKNNHKGIQLFKDSTRLENIATTDAITIEEEMNPILYVAQNGGTTYTYTYTDDNNENITEQISGLTTNINEAKKEYKHVLKTFITYSEKLKKGTENIVVNYTLDNYIRVYTENEARAGYLIDTSKIEDNKVEELRYNDVKIIPEQLSENVRYYVGTDQSNIQGGNYIYVYNEYNEKCYYDETQNRFFKIKNETRVDLENYNADPDDPEYTSNWFAKCEKKPLLLKDGTKLYQPLNVVKLEYGSIQHPYTDDVRTAKCRIYFSTKSLWVSK